MSNPISPRPVRWGVVGTGGIAAAFATDVQLLPEAEIVAVGSRTRAAAEAFADRFAIPRRHDSYAALVADDDIDAVYIATPHPGHRPHGLLAIRAGKAVLVEKPFAMNAAETRELIAEARERRTFLMEAMWTRFLPHVVRVRELVAAGRLGEIRSLTADFGGWFAPDDTHRSFAPELGGGALLDLGVYPVSFASMLFGRPERVTAVGRHTSTGVDAQTGMLLEYAGGQMATLFTTLETNTANRASINGTLARIEIEGDFFAPANFRLIGRDGSTEVYATPHQGRGLRHQVAEVGRCLRAGLTESPVLPLSETESIMETLDEIRLQIGVRYAADRG
jgi:predicted dehydrogenase